MDTPEEALSHDGSASLSLPVLRVQMPEGCAPESETCDSCVMRWIERRSAEVTGHVPEDSESARLRIPISCLDTRIDARRIDRRLRRANLDAMIDWPSRELILQFPRGRCPLHETALALEGTPCRLSLADAVLEPVTGPSLLPGRGRFGVIGAAFDSLIALMRRERDLSRVAIAGLLLLAGATTHWLGGPDALRLVLLAASAILASTKTAPEALDVLKGLRVNVDVLMFVAALGATLLHQYEEGAFLLFLFGLGAAGEHAAMARAKQAVEALAKLAPESARVLDDQGEPHEVPLEEISPGAHITLRPFERIPLDGVIVHGTSAVDQSPVTGEPVPVDKGPGDEVLAGMLNGEGPLVIRATRAAGESTLAKIMRLVEDAQAEKSKTERFTERVERIYVPIVLALTPVLVVAPALVGWLSWSESFYRAMAFLVGASPCALAIGTPAAMLCAMARSARLGVLIKGGAHLDTLARADTFAFDKTGTLTSGRPEVLAVQVVGDVDPDSMLGLAAAVESQATHPLAEAIVRAAQARELSIPAATDVRQSVGVGVSGMVDGSSVTVGRLAESQRPPALAEAERRAFEQGSTTVWVRADDRVLGFIEIADAIRPSSGEAIAELKSIGISRLALLTGDHTGAAGVIGQAVGIEDVHAGLLPDEKLREIDRLREGGHTVVMVGDGVNDAPPLARADVGVAMGAAGTDVAMETADVALMGTDLRQLAKGVLLARTTRTIVNQNLVIALGVILIVAPLGALGLADLGVAVVLHEGSTVVVVLNSLRLLKWKPGNGR